MNEKLLLCTKDSQYGCRLREVEGATFECIYSVRKCPWRRKVEPKQEELFTGGKK